MAHVSWKDYAIVYGVLLVGLAIWAWKEKPWRDAYLFEGFWRVVHVAPATASCYAAIIQFKYRVWPVLRALKGR